MECERLRGKKRVLVYSLFFALAFVFACKQDEKIDTGSDFTFSEKLRIKIPLVHLEKNLVEYSISEINIFSIGHWKIYHTCDSGYFSLNKLPESEPETFSDSTLKVIFKRWLFVDTASDEAILIDSSAEESIKIVNAIESLKSFYNIPETAFDTKGDIKVGNPIIIGDTICDVFIPKLKIDKSYPDSMYYFYTPFAGYSDFSLSKKLEQERKMKLVKIRFVYILKEELTKSTKPDSYYFNIEVERMPINARLKWQVAEKFMQSYNKLF